MSSSSGAEATADVQVEADKKSEDELQPEGAPPVVLPVDHIELSDPAILAVSVVKYRYSRDELLLLRETPLAKARHEFLDSAYDNSNGIWDPERWHCERKRSETPVENGNGNTEPSDNHRRRPGDPRERIRKEQDGIVLSPQRRSFNSGCFVPVRGQVPTRNRAHSPLGKTEAGHIVHRELPPGTRRIGSGRIVRDWDYPEKNDTDSGFGFRREHRDSERDERFERRSFGRDFEMSRDKEKDRHIGRNGRYNERRRISSENREEEPEWFSGGPVSQSDTIELRGFEENDKSSKKKQSATSKKRANKERAITKVSEMQTVEEKKETVTAAASATTTTDPKDSGATRSTPTPPDGMASSGRNRSPTAEQGGGGDASETKPVDQTASIAEQAALNFTEDFWKLPELTNGLGGDGDHAAESRFSRFFKNRESPVKAVESRRSSIQDDHHLIKNLLNEITEPTVSIPGDSESYFAPISPAANTGGAIGAQSGPQPGSKPMNIMDVLQRGKQPLPADMPPSMKSTVPGNIMSLEELEAHMRHSGAGDHSTIGQKSAQNKPDEDMTAFKRLLAQVAGGHGGVSTSNGPIPQKTQPLTLMEMLSHSQKQDELRMASAHLMGASSPNQPPPQVPNDLAMKLTLVQQQQQRMEMLQKIMNANNTHWQQLRASPLPEFNLAQSRELLSRPEAQAILQGLKRGDITPQHLYQQLANPALQPRHRELLLTILKLTGNGGLGPSPRVLSPVPPLPMFQQQQQQQQQQLRVSPLPPNALHQRIPSPRELQVHTQNILQRALIKKKLEEQQENYRKKQELQQRGQSPNSGVSPAKSVSSPTPLAFTPTSVLRKMTADKDEGKDGKNDGHGKIPQGRAVTGIRPQNQPQQLQNQWSSQYSIKQPAGRPIVKANANYQQQQQAAQQEQQQQQFFQQRLYNQQQQQMQQQQQQQRKVAQQYTSSGATLNPSNSQYPQQYSNQFQQLTQQQLRAQHQQHVRVPQQQQQQQQSLFSQQQQHQQSQWHQLLNSQQQTYDNRNSQLGRGGLDGGDLSPTSNQLARWFSPDLLERARAGKLPNMPTTSLAQHALSLEEIERQTAPAVHN